MALNYSLQHHVGAPQFQVLLVDPRCHWLDNQRVHLTVCKPQPVAWSFVPGLQSGDIAVLLGRIYAWRCFDVEIRQSVFLRRVVGQPFPFICKQLPCSLMSSGWFLPRVLLQIRVCSVVLGGYCPQVFQFVLHSLHGTVGVGSLKQSLYTLPFALLFFVFVFLIWNGMEWNGQPSCVHSDLRGSWSAPITWRVFFWASHTARKSRGPQNEEIKK